MLFFKAQTLSQADIGYQSNSLKIYYNTEPMPPLRTELNDNDDHSCTLQWVGSVESKNCHLMWFFESIETLLQHLIDVSANRLIIDLSAADRVDSEALRRLFQARQIFLRRNIRIILHQPSAHLRRLLRIMQFDQIFTVEEGGNP